MKNPELPVDALLPEIVASLQATPNLVLEAAPGAGKTTRVPPALLGLVAGEVIVLEPRRIAARLAARRVAAEMGEEVGETVGYQVRYEQVAGPKTRLRFVTEGILTRRFLSDPLLAGVDVVVLDEFHERHLDTDLALALLKRLQKQRPALKIVVMSATLETGPVAAFLGDCPVLRSEGRVFPLAIRHLPYSPKPLEVQVQSAFEVLLKEDSGHTLVFLPGVAEIRRAMRACEASARAAGAVVHALYGDLPPEEQDRVVAPSRERKLILATNVAESSVTVEGVTAVIDSGLARSASYSPWTGIPTLQVGRVSKASARQRAGRAGRTGPGQVLRLYPEEDFAMRPEHDAPEVLRSDLSGVGLALRTMGIADFGALEWLDVPPEAAVRQAEVLLDRLGASGEMAEQLARYPVAPRLARVLVEAVRRGVANEGCRAVALLAAGARTSSNDLLTAMGEPMEARTRQLMEQLRRIVRSGAGKRGDEDDLLTAMLAGFPDRVARLRAEGQVQLATGISAEIAGAVPAFQFMVALDTEDRKEKTLPAVRLFSRIEPEWLIDLFPDRVREQTTLEWNRVGERVEGVSALLYDELVLQETRDSRPDAEAAAAVLASKAMEVGIERFVDREALDGLLARVEFAGFAAPVLEEAVREMCGGLYSFAELDRAGAGFLALLESRYDAGRLRKLAPVSLRLPSGRETKVHYQQGKAPWIASRLQDFFGLRETPRIGADSTPVVVHLLAPNQRAVQTTTDLAGFWERLYPQVRRELMRRYPRHAWPERPL